MSKSDPSIAEFIIAKATREPAFRRSLLASPRKAIESLLAKPLPKDLKLAVHEDTPNKVNLILPPAQWALGETEMRGIAAAGEAPAPMGCGQPGPLGSWGVVHGSYGSYGAKG